MAATNLTLPATKQGINNAMNAMFDVQALLKGASSILEEIDEGDRTTEVLRILRVASGELLRTADRLDRLELSLNVIVGEQHAH